MEKIEECPECSDTVEVCDGCGDLIHLEDYHTITGDGVFCFKCHKKRAGWCSHKGGRND